MKSKANYYTKENNEFFAELLRAEAEKIRAGARPVVTISHENNKMGAVASVSLLPFLTCPASCASTCGKMCYAAKMAIQHGRGKGATVARSWAKNTAMAIYLPAHFWMDVERAIMAARFFRFHVSGDILNAAYFEKMVEIAAHNPHCEIMAFTKKYDIVNAFIDAGGVIPENLHILFSGWENLTPENPHALPETNVFDETRPPRDEWKICGGNCFECACRGVGCWQAKRGDVIAFKAH